MPKKPKKTNKKSDKREEVRHLLRRTDELTGNGLSFCESEQPTQALCDQFMENIAAFEEAEWISSFDLLVRVGVELPSPQELNDTRLTAKLWEVIRGLAMLRIFLYNTNHLSDRELYTELWLDVKWTPLSRQLFTEFKVESYLCRSGMALPQFCEGDIPRGA